MHTNKRSNAVPG